MLRSISVLLFAIFCSASAFAQDLVHQRDGKIIEAKIIEINPHEILLKIWLNQDGPLIILGRESVAKIIFENGVVQEFGIQKVPYQRSKPEIKAKQALKFEFLSPATNHLGFNYERVIKNGLGIEVKIGIIGIGVPTYGASESFRNDSDETDPDGNRYFYDFETSREREKGMFIKIGPKLMFNSQNSLRGFYFKPELVYSHIRGKGVEKSISVAPNQDASEFDYDYTYKFTGHSFGGLVTVGYQALIAERFTFDVSFGAGFTAQPDKLEIDGTVSRYGGPYNYNSDQRQNQPYFRYSHMQFRGVAVSMGLSFGVLL